MNRLSVNPNDLEQLKSIQSQPERRVALVQGINKYISKNWENTAFNCQPLLAKFFQNQSGWFGKSNEIFSNQDILGEGSYGIIYRANIKNLPSLKKLPVAVKIGKSDKVSSAQDREEIRKSIECGSLAENLINPHFLIIYAHFHCEYGYQNIKNFYTLNQALKLIGQLQNKIANEETRLSQIVINDENPKTQVWAADQFKKVNINEKLQIDKNLRETKDKIEYIKKNILPDPRELEKYRQLKHDLYTQLWQKYANIHDSYWNTEDPLVQQFKKVTVINDFLQNNRDNLKGGYEILIMELGGSELLGSKESDVFTWFHYHHPTNEQVFSMIFQVGSAILSMINYLGIVQNDLHIGNLLMTSVNSQTSFNYEIDNIKYKVPLEGHLFKIIDFGLSRRIGNKNDRNKLCCVYSPEFKSDCLKHKVQQCSEITRDLIEVISSVLYYANKLNLHPIMVKWLNNSFNNLLELSKIKQVILKDIVKFFNEMFSHEYLNWIESGQSFKLPRYQVLNFNNSQPIYQFSTKKSIINQQLKKLKSSLLEKNWFENNTIASRPITLVKTPDRSSLQSVSKLI